MTTKTVRTVVAIAATVTTALLLSLSLSAMTYAAQPDDTGRFSVTVPTHTIYMLSAGRVEYNGNRPKPIAAEAICWQNFVQVFDMGIPPEHGVFNVDGQPVAPAVRVINRQPAGRPATDVTVRSEMGTISMMIQSPGKFTLRVTVGQVWSHDVPIEAVQLPIWPHMTTADLLQRCGFPDKKQVCRVTPNYQFWSWNRLPGYLIRIEESTGTVVALTHVTRLSKDVRSRLRDANPFAKPDNP